MDYRTYENETRDLALEYVNLLVGVLTPDSCFDDAVTLRTARRFAAEYEAKDAALREAFLADNPSFAKPEAA